MGITHLADWDAGGRVATDWARRVRQQVSVHVQVERSAAADVFSDRRLQLSGAPAVVTRSPDHGGQPRDAHFQPAPLARAR